MERVFLAVRAHTDELEALVRRLTEDRELRVPPVENLHVTLQFLGELETAAVESLSAAVSARSLPAPFALSLEGLASFSGRVLYARVAPSDGFEALADLVDDVVDEVLGGAQSVRAMVSRQVPHVTVARPRGRGRSLRRWAREHTALSLGAFAVDELVLFASRARPRGANEYAPLQRWTLRE